MIDAVHGTRRRVRCVVAAAGAVLAGCAAKETRFDVVDYSASGETRAYVQSFDECYFATDAHRNVDVVARHTTPGAGGAVTTQVLHLRTFWPTEPGRTYAERSMINATVSYMILSGATGATFEGSGFLSLRASRRGGRMTGELERSSLTPQRRLGGADRLFDRAELSGMFAATENKPRVVEILNEMRRVFGPLPGYDASSQPDVR